MRLMPTWSSFGRGEAGAILVEKAAVTPSAPFMLGKGSARAHPDCDVSVMPQVWNIEKQAWSSRILD